MAELRFDGRVAVVTGSGRGLGREHALLLASRGAKVVVNDLGGGPFGDGDSREPAEQTVADIIARGGEAVSNFGDVGSETDAEALVRQALDAFGRIDIVVNNAGIDRFVAFGEMTREVFDRMLAVHVGGSFQVTRAAWPHMVEQGYGRVVMTSSRAAFGIPRQAHYATAKAGVIGLARALAMEGQEHGINVNAVMPSAWTRLSAATFADTDAVPSSNTQDWPPELVSPAVAWLAHESCEVTGETLDVAVGYVGRVFLGVTAGYVDRELSIEAVRDYWAEICDENGYRVAKDARNIPHGGRSLGSY